MSLDDRKYSGASEILIATEIEGFLAHGVPDICPCAGVEWNEGYGRAAQWIRIVCHHCADEWPWRKVEPEGSRLVFNKLLRDAVSHTQTCFAKARTA